MKGKFFLSAILLSSLFILNSCSNDDSCTESIWYEDSDGDGFGNPDVSRSACSQPDGFVSNSDDFDDTNANINPDTIWQGENITFTKADNADWTLEANQDRITDNVWITRQNNRPVYNYKWWQDEFSEDPTASDIEADFWDNSTTLNFTPTGGTKGVKWTLLDDTGSTSDWSGYNFGKLGDPDNFHSFNNIIQIIGILENVTGDFSTISVTDDFTVRFNGSDYSSPSIGSNVVGKKFGVWLVEDNVYLTLTFKSWGSGGGGGFSYERSTEN